MRILRFLIPLGAVLLIDLLFQFGVWEPLATPESHAGMSIAKKFALRDPAFAHIDFVTLGSSRAVYGIDHALVSNEARQRNFVHANMSVAGMHWMSLGVFTDWLTQHHPEVRGGIIALGVQDFLAPGNGSYEIGIAYPFRTLAEIPWMQAHVPFDWHDPATYALYSGLFEYHEDIQDYVRHPARRHELLQYFHGLSAQQVLAASIDEPGDICAAKVEALDDCARVVRDGGASNPNMAQQCTRVSEIARQKSDLNPFLDGRALPEYLQKTHDMLQAQLLALRWPRPPVVVLMPMHSIWLNEALPAGTHAWALSILTPLARQGRIRLLDYTDFFSTNSGASDCSAFFDLYHNNLSGRARLMERLLPELKNVLLDTGASESLGRE